MCCSPRARGEYKATSLHATTFTIHTLIRRSLRTDREIRTLVGMAAVLYAFVKHILVLITTTTTTTTTITTTTRHC